jgi:putative effector of murein hydrolase LrgA (UPF0299 family)
MEAVVATIGTIAIISTALTMAWIIYTITRIIRTKKKEGQKKWNQS